MLFEDVDKREVQLMRSIKVKYFRGVVHMKTVLFLVLSLVLVLSACSNGSVVTIQVLRVTAKIQKKL